jgi:CheY-like chemotaxis protein
VFYTYPHECLKWKGAPVKRRILLVDDDVAVLLTVKAVLELNEFSVDTASSATEAIEKLASGVYQMVITDARMENENAGFEVVQAARRQAYHPATALLTAYPPREGDWKHDGAQSFLVKPMGTQDLLRQIEALLVLREDGLRENGMDGDRLWEGKKLLSPRSLTLPRHTAPSHREVRKKAG